MHCIPQHDGCQQLFFVQFLCGFVCEFHRSAQRFTAFRLFCRFLCRFLARGSRERLVYDFFEWRKFAVERSDKHVGLETKVHVSYDATRLEDYSRAVTVVGWLPK